MKPYAKTSPKIIKAQNYVAWGMLKRRKPFCQKIYTQPSKVVKTVSVLTKLLLSKTCCG